MVFRTCESIHSDDKHVCDILHTDSQSQEALKLEAESQPRASYILMCDSLLNGIVPAFLSFFIGPWSDKYGRKPLMLAGYSGSAVSLLLRTILCTRTLDPWFYLLCSLPPALLGGMSGLILASLCFVTDIRSEGDRAWHLTWLQAVISGGIFLGSFAGSELFKLFGYSVVFGVASACSTLATLYVIFIVPETVVRTDTNQRFCTLFDVSLVKDMFAACSKKRDGFNRVIVWSCITCLSLNVLTIEGDYAIGFLFASAKFGWNVSDYSSYQAAAVLFGIVGTLLGAKFFQAFVDKDMLDMRIAMFANISAFVGAMTKSLVRKPWHLYCATAFAMYSGLLSPVLRAILSKSGPPQDAGKIFSLTQSMEAVVPLAASPLYTLVYTRNMPPIYPSPVFQITAGILLVILILIILIDRELGKLKNSPYVSINEDVD
ncbi:proton-coupled folate transporter-like isoform X2 [Venturia canescens]|nr:proton-coupled folate transporter-like isoform X2 [Venturia canescens]XP_043289899.1 proton-coupled folate transporter-like isoform X2 [Venturia canescens]